MSFTIRPAQLNDVPGIARVHVDTWRTTYGGLVPDEVLHKQSARLSADQWRSVLEANDPERTLLVAELDQQIVGFANGGPERGEYPDYDGELYALYVLADYQDRNIGRQLLRRVAADLHRAGMQQMLVWVLATNPARLFYEVMGGRLVHEKTMEVGGVPLDTLGFVFEDLAALGG
ncbi:MAG: GNAT family N-acetyltransferase [Candidatus Promineifilaceae bacterium]|nr:GNAT family N-acetyltransferase [Candidatus Promineifilaceae bacterium]